MKMIKKAEFKKCPYCKMKNHINAVECYNCSLNFHEIKEASNIKAKKMIARKKFGETFEGEIVYVKEYTPELSRIKTLIWCLTLGYFGAHSFYVGKFLKGIVSLVLGILSIVFFFIMYYNMLYVRTDITDIYMLIGSVCSMFPLVSMLFDLVAIITKKDTIPVALKTPLDLPEDD